MNWVDAMLATYWEPGMWRARAQARRYAELMHYHDEAGAGGVIGVWPAWLAFAGQWAGRPAEHTALSGVFTNRLDELRDGGDDFPDTW